MSHAPERTEKDCLNCGATVAGRYCQVCGQENIVPKESFGHLVLHFFYDITHFDGKFFETLKDLLFRPGFLSSEYIKGRRVAYLNPVRMYVFTSAIFFLIFFIIVKSGAVLKTNENDPLSPKDRERVIRSLRNALASGDEDSAAVMRQLTVLLDTTHPITNGQLNALDSGRGIITFTNTDYTNRHVYDSVQHSLPKDQRDGWFKRTMIYRQIAINEKSKDDPKHFLRDFFDRVLHLFPYILFVSLPLFALILKLLYIRRKNFYYADHAIFTIHHYIFSFILLLVFFLFGAIYTWLGWKFMQFLQVIVFLVGPVYLYIAMKRFYRQGWLKTFFKFLLQNLIAFFVLLFLFVAFFFFAIFEI